MRKVIIAAAVVLFIAAGVGAGYHFLTKDNDNESPENQETAQVYEQDERQPNQDETLTVDSAIAKLQAANFTVGEREAMLYQMIGAINGSKVYVNGVRVEFYEFDNESQLATAKQQLDELNELFAGDLSTRFSIGNLIVIVHSTDNTKVDAIRNALQ